MKQNKLFKLGLLAGGIGLGVWFLKRKNATASEVVVPPKPVLNPPKPVNETAVIPEPVDNKVLAPEAVKHEVPVPEPDDNTIELPPEEVEASEEAVYPDFNSDGFMAHPGY